jgi:hypothetical protein
MDEEYDTVDGSPNEGLLTTPTRKAGMGQK